MIYKRTTAKWLGVAVAGVGLAAVASCPVFAADVAQTTTTPTVTQSTMPDVAKEVATAEQHAEMAAAATDLKTVHVHLQHVINCLVGPSSKNFDAKGANPCAGMGNGALTDTLTRDVPKNRALELALDRAQSGLHEDELKAAQKAGSDVEKMLKKQV